MNKMKKVYNILLKEYGPQGWWPIIDNKTLLCEYGTGAPKNELEVLEICIGAILAQGTQWKPNVVTSLRQLKLGRELTKEEQEVIKELEKVSKKISKKRQKTIQNNILTQNTNWNNVEKALKNLRPITVNRLDKISENDLDKLIKPSGYYNQKAKKIKFFIKFLKEKNKINRKNLLGIWGLGPETVDSILLYAYNQPYFVIDAYTKRIFSRLGYEYKTYDEWQQFFHENVNKKIYKEYHALLVEHAKRFCTTKPKCKKCSLKELCQFR
ncbi:MAG: hypothetical protein ABIF40_03805 [archaeon]